MILADVNVLVYAFRSDSVRHDDYRTWLKDVMGGQSTYGVSPQVLAGVIRICTNPRIFAEPSPLERALAFCDDVLAPPQARVVQPGERHWSIFRALCADTKTTGNLAQDAWYAALAMEHGCEWVSTDSDYDLFPGLRWRRPFD
jgi:uncharacterized protein